MGFGTIFKADAIVPDGQGNFWTEYILRFSRMKAREQKIPEKGLAEDRGGMVQ